MENDKWCIFRSKPGQDRYAAFELRQQQFAVYLARTYEKGRDGKKVVAVPRLRFSGYGFVGATNRQCEFGKVPNTRGILDLITKVGGDPHFISEDVVTGLQRLEDEEEEAITKRVRRKQTFFKPGDVLVIDDKDHPAHGVVGLLLGEERGQVEILGGCIVWKVRIANVRKAAPGEESKLRALG